MQGYSPPVSLQQYNPVLCVLCLHLLHQMGLLLRAIQLLKDLIQSFNEILPVVLHPNPTKVLPDRALHLLGKSPEVV